MMRLTINFKRIKYDYRKYYNKKKFNKKLKSWFKQKEDNQANLAKEDIKILKQEINDLKTKFQEQEDALKKIDFELKIREKQVKIKNLNHQLKTEKLKNQMLINNHQQLYKARLFDFKKNYHEDPYAAREHKQTIENSNQMINQAEVASEQIDRNFAPIFQTYPLPQKITKI